MIGPKIEVKRSCTDCEVCQSESYAVQGDSGFRVYCAHPSLPQRKRIGDTAWSTPDWCPVIAEQVARVRSSIECAAGLIAKAAGAPALSPREEPPGTCAYCEKRPATHVAKHGAKNERPCCDECDRLPAAPAPSSAQVLACPYCKPDRPCYADTPSPDPSKRCPECKGRGWHPGDCHPREECAKCEGTGWAASPSGNGSATP